MKLDHLLTLYIGINLKWINDLNVRLKTIKILEENIGTKILDIAQSNIFFWYMSSGKGNKQTKKINKWNTIKLQSFSTVNETINLVNGKRYSPVAYAVRG